MSFRLTSRNLLLTYSQCNRSKEDLHAYLLTLDLAEHVLVARETHQDGNFHLHAYFGFTRKPDIKNPRYFDWDGFHPNIASRPKRIAITYCTKHDTDPISNFNWKTTKKVEEAYQAIIHGKAAGKSNDELFEKAIETDNSLIRCAPAIGYFINRISKESRLAQARFELDSFPLPPDFKAHILEWKSICDSMEAGDRRISMSLWFFGPSMTGKTSLACSIGSHWYMQANWNVTNIADEDHVYGVMDDIEWDWVSRYYKSILGRQLNVDLTDKYKHKRSYKLGFPVIMCSNELPDFTPQQRDWLRFNVEFWEFQTCNNIKKIVF